MGDGDDIGEEEDDEIQSASEDEDDDAELDYQGMIPLPMYY